MTRRTARFTGAMALLTATLFVTATAAAEMLFAADFEDGSLFTGGPRPPGINACEDCLHAITVSRQYARSGDHAVRFQLRPGDPPSNVGNWRSELSLKTTPYDRIDPVGTYWYAWSVLVPTDNPVDSATEIAGQWHGTRDRVAGRMEAWRSPPLALQLEDNTWKLRLRWDAHEVSTKATIQGPRDLPLGAATPGYWQDFVFRVTWSAGQPGGQVTVWRRHATEVDWERLVHLEDHPMGFNDLEGPYLKIGIYKFMWKHGAERMTRTLFFDDVRIGTADESLATMAPGAHRD